MITLNEAEEGAIRKRVIDAHSRLFPNSVGAELLAELAIHQVKNNSDERLNKVFTKKEIAKLLFA